jgi:hypothetical protein
MTVSMLSGVVPMQALNAATKSTAKPSKAKSIALRRGEGVELVADIEFRLIGYTCSLFA